MIRVAIVEDEAAVRGQLTQYLQRYTRQYGAAFQVSEFESGAQLLMDYRPVYDLVLMDIEMPVMDGMETARHLRALDSGVMLLFITNTAKYAINGYAVGALDYLLKPVPYFAFSQLMHKAARQIQAKTQHTLLVTVEDGLRRVDTAALYYIESDGHYAHFYGEEGDFLAQGTLKSFEEKLAGQPFMRCNSGYLVNLAQVTAVQQDTVLAGPYRLQMSRPRRKAFLVALADHIGGTSQ